MTPGTEPTFILRGEPKPLDSVYRPPARAAAIGLGLIAGALLAWFGAWLWAPLPLAALVVLYETIFQLRADRSIRVTLSGHTIAIDDRKLGTTATRTLTGARTAVLGVVRSGGPIHDVLLGVHTDDETLLAAQLAVPTAAVPAAAVDLRALRTVLGGRPSLVRGLGPADRVIRQTLRDTDGAAIQALLAQLPPDATERCAVRVWRGREPETDFMGQLLGPPTGLLILDRDGWRLHTADGQRRGSFGPLSWGRSTRTIELLNLGVGDPQVAHLPMIVWALHRDLTLAIPAPVAGLHGEERDTPDEALHLHLPEAAMLIGWAWRSLPPQALPAPLREPAPDR